jgi:methylated-DNA-[protein]-cysteine S-methyltransferase
MHYRIFATALGEMGVGWTADGVNRFRLPGTPPAAMAAAFERAGYAKAASGQGDLAARIVAYAEGAPDAFQDIAVDLSGVPEQARRIYEHIRGLGWGTTTSYGAIARWLGDVALSRAVGAAMGANPIPLIIPCHRVMAADGRTGGFSAPGGVDSKLKLLALENAASPTGQLSLGI